MRNKFLSALAALVVSMSAMAGDVVDQTNENGKGKKPEQTKQLIVVQDEKNNLLNVYDADNVAKEVFDKANAKLSEAKREELFKRDDVLAAVSAKRPALQFPVLKDGDSKKVESTEACRWFGHCGGWFRPWLNYVWYYPAVITYRFVSWGWNWGWNNWGCYGW